MEDIREVSEIYQMFEKVRKREGVRRAQALVDDANA